MTSAAVATPYPSRWAKRGGLTLVLLAFAMLSGCAPLPPPDPGGTFSITDFFEGETKSQGEVTTLYVWTSPFTARFRSKIERETFRLQEHFAFADGDPLQIWQLNNSRDGRYAGTVKTMLNTGRFGPTVAVEGYRTADGAVLNYDGYAPGGSSVQLHFRHWMVSRPDGTVLNDVAVTKFGMQIAHAKVVFSKVPPGEETAPTPNEADF